jgi:negative regulator of sigma E activity
MNEAIRMQVSAFVDGELPDNEADLLLRRLCQDTDLRQQVAEYMAIGRIIRGEYALKGSYALRERIVAELDQRPLQEPADSVQEARRPRFVRPVAGAAIAATVALVAIFGLGRVADVENPVPAAAVVAEEVVSETVPRMTEEQGQLYRLHGDDSESFFTRMISLEIRADELAEVAEDATVEDEAEDEAEQDSDGTEPVSGQP